MNITALTKILTQNDVLAIDRSLAPGQVVEVRLTVQGALISSRIESPMDINLPRLVLCCDQDCEIILTIQKSGDYPVEIHRQRLPANYYIRAISGYIEEGDHGQPDSVLDSQVGLEQVADEPRGPGDDQADSQGAAGS